jgi:hypothetical protein
MQEIRLVREYVVGRWPGADGGVVQGEWRAQSGLKGTRAGGWCQPVRGSLQEVSRRLQVRRCF